QLPVACAFAFEALDLGVLPGEKRRQERPDVPLERLAYQLALSGKYLPVPSDQEIDGEAEAGKQGKGENPGQRRLRPAVLHDDEGDDDERIEARCDRNVVDHELPSVNAGACRTQPGDRLERTVGREVRLPLFD